MGDVPLQVWGVLAPIAAGAAVALGGLWANRHMGLNPAKDSLIDALQKRVTLLETEGRELKERLGHLEQVNQDLRDANDTLMRENAALRRTRAR